MINLQLGNCLEVLKKYEDNSIDAVVTDPPYGLSFMGKHWDYDVPSVEIWKEVLRVLKPGGYLLSFAGTRTQHRMACNIEDAGFEIRDMIAWIYGSGFPKSLNIGKAIDKMQGNEREVVGITSSPNGKEGGYEGERYKEKRVTAFGVVQDQPEKSIGSSEWEGWGTALKPALEPITMARKPLSEKTVAENVLKWGTGGINIDGCRVPLGGDYKSKANGRPSQTGLDDNYNPEIANTPDTQGRFPANLIHDGSQMVLDLFPESKSGAMKKPYKYTNTGNSLGSPTGETKQIHEANSGSAARFFYCAKASRSERNEGCEEIEPQHKRRDDGQPYGMNTNEFRPDGSERKEVQPQNNFHPTVKPISLMEYLVKLVSREGSTVLDPFLGSGSTGIACINLNRLFIGIEREQQYLDIATKRIENALKKN